MDHTGRTTINIKGSTYVLKFGMGALMHFSDELGFDVNQTFEELTQGGVKQIKAVSKFIYSALVVDAIYAEKELNLSISDIIEWVDSSSVNDVTQVVRVIMRGISKISEVDFPESKEDSKKK